MDFRVGVYVRFLAHEHSLQHHLRALREGEIIKDAGSGERVVEPKLLQLGKLNPLAGGLASERHVVGVNVDEF